jgi:GDP-L-fucose synthase
MLALSNGPCRAICESCTVLSVASLDQYKKILVTGASGFLGLRLTFALDRLSHSPHVVVLTSRNCDLRQEHEARYAFGAHKPDVVFHLAAVVGGIGANASSPGTFFRDNMRIGLNVLEAARQTAVKKVVIAGTVCAYPRDAPLPLREKDLWNGFPEDTNAPYGIAKRVLTVMAEAYRKEYDSNFVTALIANLYGPGDNFDLERSHVIPGMIRRFVEAKERGEVVRLWGDGSPSREFLYVDDAVRGLIAVASGYDDTLPINLGTGHETRIDILASLIAEIVGYNGEITWDGTRPNGQLRRVLDVTRARDLVDFVSSWSLRNGLEKTVEWFLSHRPSAA